MHPVLLALAALLLAASVGPAQPPVPLPWVVNDDVTYEGVPLLVTADITVGPGGALRLRGVEALVLGAPAHVPRITVQAGGTLELVDGAALVDGATGPTTLEAVGAAFDLVVEPGGALRAKNATLRGARIELGSDGARFEATHLNLSAGPLRVTGGSPSIEGGVLEGSPATLLQVEAGALRVEGATLRYADGGGAMVMAGAALHLVGSEVRDVGGYGVQVDGGSLVLERTAFTDTADYALHTVAASVALRDNAFETHCGAYLIEGSTGTVEGNLFNNTGHGLTIENPGPVRIAGNAFRGAQEGLFVSGAAPDVTANRFENNVRGVVLRATDATLEGNLFEGNGGGLQVQSVDGPSQPRIMRNAFVGNTDFGLQNELEQAVDARGNWWGSPLGPRPAGDGDMVVGPVDAAPWLTTPP